MSSINTQSLLDWARARTPESRGALAGTITDLFAEGTDRLSHHERALMGDILHRVVVDLEFAVRKTLSEKLANLPDVPEELISFLANDDAEVAYPVLTRSPLMKDADLIEVIRHRTLEHQLAIANRFQVSEAVSGELAATGSVTVVEALLRNENARISQATLACLVEESRRIDAFREPLVRRSDLGADLAKRLFLWVSAALRNHIVKRFELDSDTVDTLLEQAAMENIAADAPPSEVSGTERLADELAEREMLDTEMLVNALTIGEVNLFVAMFARMTDLRERLVQRLLFAPSGEQLAVACKAVGIDRATFETLFTLSRSARPQLGNSQQDHIRQAVDVFESIGRKDAERVVHRWQLNPDFTAAINELEAMD